MRHRLQDQKLGRSTAHRAALMSSLVCNLVRDGRIMTTLAKAKGARRLAEKMVTLGKRGTVAARRRAASILHQAEFVQRLFNDVAPRFAERHGGYVRIMRVGRRRSDDSEMVFLEWVDQPAPTPKKKKASKSEKAE